MTDARQTQSMVRKAYDLNGLKIAIFAPSMELANCWEAFLAPLAIAQDIPAADWNLSIRVEDTLPQIPTGDVIYDGNLPEGLPVILSRKDDANILLVPDQLIVVTEGRTKNTNAIVRTGCEKAMRGTASIHALEDIIRCFGQFMLHAACLLHPSSDDTLLIFAPSGTGKTTTSLALAHAGWRLMGDDVTILSLTDGAPTAWSLPRWLTVHRNTEALMPWLSQATKPWETRDEQAVPLANVAPLIHVASPRPHPCRTLVMLERPNAHRHEIGTIDPSEAMLRILCDNLSIAPQGLTEQGIDYLDAVTTMVNSAQLIRLSVGPDIASLGETLAAACRNSR